MLAAIAPCFSPFREYAVNEVVAGIREYFNVMLGTQLLYKFERPQYAEILAEHPEMPMSQVYGAPHLLRLFGRETHTHTTRTRKTIRSQSQFTVSGTCSGSFSLSASVCKFPPLVSDFCPSLTVRIGAMLAYTPLDEKSLALLLSYLEDFLK